MMKFTRFIVLAAVLFPSWGLAFDHTHQQLQSVLDAVVVEDGSTTQVKYKELKESPENLRGYLQALSGVSVAEYERFSRAQQLSFLINAYNAFTLRLIIEHYPVKSIKEIGGLFSSPWKKKFFTLLGKKTHLDDLEHGIIRKEFDEPRIHFAVNCASIGCPPLSKKVFTEENLEELLSKTAENFIKTPTFNRWDEKSMTLSLSSIFKWYGSDFDNSYGSHILFVVKTLDLKPEIVKLAETKKLSVEYLDYDWNLNDAK